jgi:hypothetical protein
MFESVNNDGSFYMKPGGTMEEASPTSLPGNLYSEVSGITKQGATCKMPGKELVKRYADRVIQIVSFGNGYLLQHGSTVEYHPDTCKQARLFTLDLPNSIFPPISGSGPRPSHPGEVGYSYHPNLISVTLFSVAEDNTRIAPLHTWTEADFLVNPDDAGHWVEGTTAASYKKIDFTAFVPDEGGKFGFGLTILDRAGIPQQTFPNVQAGFTAITQVAPEASTVGNGPYNMYYGYANVVIGPLAQTANFKVRIAINLD